MTDKEVLERLRAEWSGPFHRWDFSCLAGGRVTIDARPWQLDPMLARAIARADAMVESREMDHATLHDEPSSAVEPLLSGGGMRPSPRASAARRRRCHPLSRYCWNPRSAPSWPPWGGSAAQEVQDRVTAQHFALTSLVLDCHLVDDVRMIAQALHQRVAELAPMLSVLYLHDQHGLYLFEDSGVRLNLTYKPTSPSCKTASTAPWRQPTHRANNPAMGTPIAPPEWAAALHNGAYQRASRLLRMAVAPPQPISISNDMLVYVLQTVSRFAEADTGLAERARRERQLGRTALPAELRGAIEAFVCGRLTTNESTLGRSLFVDLWQISGSIPVAI